VNSAMASIVPGFRRRVIRRAERHSAKRVGGSD
jgi:hypothetical protein